MKSSLLAGLLLMCLGTATVAVLSMAGFASSVHAQSTETWQYAYLIDVERVDLYENEIQRSWNASRADKAYMLEHVFSYERGFSGYDLTLNKLKRMNELGAEGWELYDEPSGLLRRRR